MKSSRYLALGCIVSALGCNGTSTSSTAPKENQSTEASVSEGYPSPDAVFAAFSKAASEDDWGSAITLVTDESKKMLVTGMVMQATFSVMEDESKSAALEQLFNKHGITEDMQEPTGIGPDSDVDSLVDDLPAFVGDLASWISANETDSEGGFPELTSLADVKVDGESATGMVETEMGAQPIEFQKIDGQWKVHLATGPPPAPTVDELGVDFEDIPEGDIGSMKIGEKSSRLAHAFAYRAKFFDEPCIVLVLTEVEVSDEKRAELEQDLKEGDGDAMFFADGPKVQLTLSPEGDLLSMFAWIDNTSLSSNRGPAVDVQIVDDEISGRVAMAPKEFGEDELEFVADFETEIQY